MGVTKALSDLGAAVLVRMFGHDVRLTEEGERAASATLERHRFFERLLVESGVDAETASAEACRIEHCLSEDSYRRFAAYLGSRRAAARLSPCRTITSFNRPRPNGWVPFTRVHLGQRASRPAQGRSHNTQHQTRQKRRTTDAGPRTTAPRKTSIPTTTEQLQLLGRRPHGRLLLFRDLAES